MATLAKAAVPTRYADDVAAWADEQVALLRAGRLADVDIDHIIEEIEGVANSERRALASQIARVIEHLLKLEFSPAIEPRRGWQVTILDARGEIDDIFASSPSLRREVDTIVQRQAGRAARSVAKILLERAEIDRRLEDAMRVRRYTADEILGDWFPPDPA